MFIRQFRYMAEDTGNGDAGTGGAGGADPGAQNPGAADPGTTFLSQGQSAEQIAAAKTAADAAAAQHAWIPEKSQVKKQDGTVDVEASAKKLAENYKALETKMGADGVRPGKAEEYKFEVPPELKDQWKPEEDQQFKDFQVDAHKLGFTQAQFQYAVSRHLEMLGQIGADGGADSLDDNDLKELLSKNWKDEASFNKNTNAAYRAVAAYANPGSADVLGSYVNLDRKFGRDPDFIAFMANIGRETNEDIAPMGALMSDQSVEELQKSQAYWDETDPKHAETKKKVQAHFARKYGTAENSR